MEVRQPLGQNTSQKDVDAASKIRRDKMTQLPEIKPLATMEEAWAEKDRLWAEADRRLAESYGRLAESSRLLAKSWHLWAEGDRLRAESDQVVRATAEAIYGKDVAIDWIKRTASPKKGERP